MTAHVNREAWLNAFAREARPAFDEAGYPLPENVRIAIGFPSSGKRSKVIGECWTDAASADGHFEIFLRPSLESDARIADVLTHELVHAAVGIEARHGGPFARCARALGLEGKLTATTAGEAWREWALPILEKLGPLPHAPLTSANLSSAKPKQGTRMLKLTCNKCGFTCRTTQKHIDAAGDGLICPIPICDGDLERD
ncbi:hypothetical protein BSL82_10045 [Tardibacter chloracetimidivorans]|uniref:Uncharacterized protein n=1 Tax=Tardibacter chloracetimidivorans TaxID=1921510 RepID=A0A1L3ZVD3_9SPHN|nr:SprT-like domain-containing protein [Tardibacter chloracetimidivorans]API59614.1 hypothetical protein BSL82_10045 [Tardibacter chloracetimidivorans]